MAGGGGATVASESSDEASSHNVQFFEGLLFTSNGSKHVFLGYLKCLLQVVAPGNPWTVAHLWPPHLVSRLGGGQLVQSLQMKPQIIRCSFSRELFTSNGSKNFFLTYLKYPLLKIGTAGKKKTNVFFSLVLSFFVTNFIIYVIYSSMSWLCKVIIGAICL